MALRLVLLVIVVVHSLYAHSLLQYIDYVLQDNNEIRNLADEIIYARLNVDGEKNRYDVKFYPDSTIATGSTFDRFRFGFRGSKKNMYGGEVYGDISASRIEYEDSIGRYSATSSLGYRQSLWKKFGKEYNTLGLFSAKESFRIQKLRNKERVEDIITQAVGYYYNVLLAKKTIEIQKQSLKRGKLYYEAAEAKQRSGLVSKIDVYRAKISYLTQKKALNNSIKNYEDALENAIFFINKDKESFSFDFNGTIEPFHYTLEPITKEEILNSNVLWLDLISREEILYRRQNNAYVELFPDIMADVSYSRYSLDGDLAHTFDMREDDWSFGLSVNYEFDKFNQKKNIQLLHMEKRKLQREKKELQHSIFKSFREVQFNVRTLQEDMEIEQLKMMQAKESLEVAKIRYERGLSGNLDLIDAENAYLNSQITYYQIVQNYNLAIIRYLDEINKLDRFTIAKLMEQ